MKYMKPLTILPALIMMCLIFSFSSQTGEESGSLSYKISLYVVEAGNSLFDLEYDDAQIQTQAKKIEHPVRKLAHMSEYCLLALTVCLPLYTYHVRGLKLFLLVLFICAAFAGTDEYHQSFVAGRGPSITDVAIDTIGALIGDGVFLKIPRPKFNKPRP